jgi:hypothetical protein
VTARRRVLLLAPARSYRVTDFVRAATRMGVELTVPVMARCLWAAGQ